MKNIIYLLFVCMIAISCQQNESTDKAKAVDSPSETAKTDTLPTPNSKKEMQAPIFVIDSFTDDSESPRSTISLEMDGRKIEVTEAIGSTKIERKDYEQYQIPSEAVDACGGWWAGSGDYFYIIKHPEKNYYMVMQAVVDEQQAGSTYDYSSIMNITQRFK